MRALCQCAGHGEAEECSAATDHVVFVQVETGRVAGRVAVHDMLPAVAGLGRVRIDQAASPRTDAVGPDQHVSGDPAAVGETDLDAVGAVRGPGHPLAVVYSDASRGRQLLQCPVQRGPRERAGRTLDRPVPEPLALSVEQRHRPRRERHRVHRLSRADPRERGHAVAHHGEERAGIRAAGRARLVHLGFDAGFQQGQRGRGPRDTTTGDDHFAYGHAPSCRSIHITRCPHPGRQRR
jgi:hypothetical protein